MGAIVQINAEWQANVRYYSKSVTRKLQDIGDAFGFKIQPEILSDHEELAALRWSLQNSLGKDNPVATKALTKLFFAYLRGGRDFLYDSAAIERLFEKLIKDFSHHAVATDASVSGSGRLKVLESETVNPLISKYHFLGYGRDDGLHLGMQCGEDDDDVGAVATFSPWDIAHADHVLEQLGIFKSEILVLSRLLSVPGRRRIALSRFIALLIGWVRREMKEIKAIATYCNPNAGHYGTVYRGANFIPLCFEEHAFVPFMDEEYVSPRKFQQLRDEHIDDSFAGKWRRGAVTPIPLLLYWYPVRGMGKGQRALRSCRYPYPADLLQPGANGRSGT